MSTTNIRVVAPLPPEVMALSNTCEALAKSNAIDRFELAVKSRCDAGIQNDNDLRLTDELLHQVVLGGDAVEDATKPTISLLNGWHKQAIATVKPWKERWSVMRSALDRIILDYSRRKTELARQQQMELERAAEAERKRLELEAKKALRNGDVAAAQAAMRVSQSIVTPVIGDAAPTLDNTGTRSPWQVEINAEDFLKGFAAGMVPIDVMISAIKAWDETFLKKEAAKRGGLNWPGVRAWQAQALTHKR